MGDTLGRHREGWTKTTASASFREAPEEILDRRFARGEIDVETYQLQRETLARTRGGSTHAAMTVTAAH